MATLVRQENEAEDRRITRIGQRFARRDSPEDDDHVSFGSVCGIHKVRKLIPTCLVALEYMRQAEDAPIARLRSSPTVQRSPLLGTKIGGTGGSIGGCERTPFSTPQRTSREKAGPGSIVYEVLR